MTREREELGELYRYSGLGLTFAATLGVFALLGHGLDRWIGTGPWGLIVGVFAGFGLGLYSMTKKLPARRPPRGPRDPSA